ncbi:GtrA family protein [Streptococcus pluranimalium]
MKNQKKTKLIQNEVVKYLFFGILATIVYITFRLLGFTITNNVSFSVILANIVAILFAFFTNDFYVFPQRRSGWIKRLIKFFIARLFTLFIDFILAYLLVEKFPDIIGMFVDHNLAYVNGIETMLGQIVVIVLNYVISKFLIFNK